jgi:hypothetical protein
MDLMKKINLVLCTVFLWWPTAKLHASNAGTEWLFGVESKSDYVRKIRARCDKPIGRISLKEGGERLIVNTIFIKAYVDAREKKDDYDMQAYKNMLKWDYEAARSRAGCNKDEKDAIEYFEECVKTLKADDLLEKIKSEIKSEINSEITQN